MKFKIFVQFLPVRPIKYPKHTCFLFSYDLYRELSIYIHKSKIWKEIEIFIRLDTAILSNLKGNSKLTIIRQPNSILNLSVLPNSLRNPIKTLLVESDFVTI